MSRALVLALMTLAVFAAPSQSAQRTDWPTKPVRFIVPFPPNGTVDPLARLLGTRLASSLGHQFVVDNRTGSGAIAAKSAPGGYTYVFVRRSFRICLMTR